MERAWSWFSSVQLSEKGKKKLTSAPGKFLQINFFNCNKRLINSSLIAACLQLINHYFICKNIVAIPVPDAASVKRELYISFPTQSLVFFTYLF